MAGLGARDGGILLHHLVNICTTKGYLYVHIHTVSEYPLRDGGVLLHHLVKQAPLQSLKHLRPFPPL